MKKNITIFLLAISLFTLAGCSDKKTVEYRADLKTVSDNMFENASTAEDILNQYATVWSYSIKSGGSIRVEEMAKLTGIDEESIEEYFTLNPIGNIPDDFSININSLSAYYEGTGQLEEIRKNSSDIKSKITALNNPPEEYKKVYDEVLDLYNLTEEYTGMAIKPDGSLQSFNESRDQLTSEIISKNKRIEVILPKEK